ATGRGPVQGRVQGRQFENEKPAQLLLGLGERTVLHLPPALPKADGRGRRRLLQGRPTDIDVRLLEGLVVRPPGRDVLLACGVAPPVDVGGGLIDDHAVAPRSPLWAPRPVRTGGRVRCETARR